VVVVVHTMVQLDMMVDQVAVPEMEALAGQVLLLKETMVVVLLPAQVVLVVEVVLVLLEQLVTQDRQLVRLEELVSPIQFLVHL
jgi:hypothetical protein